MKTYAELFSLVDQSQWDKVAMPLATVIGSNVDFKLTLAYDALDSTLYLFFPGTYPDTKSWFEDFKFWKKSYKKSLSPHTLVDDSSVLVHDGFLEVYLFYRDALIAEVNKFGLGPRRIVVSGYSQGAAVATLCINDLLIQQAQGGLPKVPIHTVVFASPRVYNFYGAKVFNHLMRSRPDCCFNSIIHYKDLVTMVPPWIFDFKHVMNKNRTILGGSGWFLFGDPMMHLQDRYMEVLTPRTDLII